MPADEIERRWLAANQAINDMDRALEELRVAMQKVDAAMQAAKERGAWNS